MAGQGGYISARSDAEAVAEWLAEYRASPRTRRAYRREAERLLLWLAERDMTLNQVRRDHLEGFEAFLADPQPRSRWVGPPRPRQAEDWRPFRGPLSPASRRQSLVILQGMYAWLAEAGWVAHNPFRLMRDKRRRLDNRQGGIERYLEAPLWDWFWGWLTGAGSPAMEEGGSSREQYERHRRRFVFGFAYLLAPRISEMSAARMGDFQRREGRWWWNVVGKGGKTGSIPVPPDMLTLLTEWRLALGLSLEPQLDDATPLLRALDGRRGIGDNRLYRLDPRDIWRGRRCPRGRAGGGRPWLGPAPAPGDPALAAPYGADPSGPGRCRAALSRSHGAPFATGYHRPLPARRGRGLAPPAVAAWPCRTKRGAAGADATRDEPV